MRGPKKRKRLVRVCSVRTQCRPRAHLRGLIGLGRTGLFVDLLLIGSDLLIGLGTLQRFGLRRWREQSASSICSAERRGTRLLLGRQGRPVGHEGQRQFVEHGVRQRWREAKRYRWGFCRSIRPGQRLSERFAERRRVVAGGGGHREDVW